MPIFKHFSGKTRIYLDYASSTPRDMGMARRVPKIPIRIHAANPSALHSEGVALRRVLNDARERVARVLEVHRDEIIFTSGATESDNLAIVGAIYGLLKKGIAHNDIVVISSDLEHAAVTETIKHVVTSGVRHVSLSTTDGVVDPKDIVVPNGAKAVVVSVMYVNNEIGTVQPISDIAKRMRKLRADHPNVQFIFHTDATQAPLHFSLRVPALGVDLMTLGATKLYCTKGVGALYKKRAVELMPVLHGGGQEFGMRPGTESVELMHEFSHALLYAQERREAFTLRAAQLQTYFETELEKHFPHLKITAQQSPRTPHITHIGVSDFDSELLVLELDARGIAVSAKSACKNEETGESPIVEKLYGKHWGAVRFSFGRMTDKHDLDKAIGALRSIFEKYTYSK